MLIDAIKKAGPNRYRIRDIMAILTIQRGVCGLHALDDARGKNIAPNYLRPISARPLALLPAAKAKAAPNRREVIIYQNMSSITSRH